MNKKDRINISLSQTQVWVVAKALSFLTIDYGVTVLKKEFPLMDDEKMLSDIDGIIDQLGGGHD